MPVTTFCNGKPIAHTLSDGKNASQLDVCNTPVGNSVIPIPYPNVAELKKADPGTCPKTVTFDGGVPLTMGSKIPQSQGDESGSQKGIISGDLAGESEFLLYSFDVFVEGNPLCRGDDLTWHNKKNTVGQCSINGNPPKEPEPKDFEFMIEDDLGNPLSNKMYRIKHSGKIIKEGSTDATGKITISGIIDTESLLIEFPDKNE